MKLDKNVVRQWATLLSILAAFFTNVLANISPINGLPIGDISNEIF